MLGGVTVDDVPDAIKVGIWYETNESMASDEYHGYVPESYLADNAEVEGKIVVLK
jgi:hypothetical protein